MKITILKKGMRHAGKYIGCRYSMGSLVNYPEGTISVYVKDGMDRLPKELNPKNDSDPVTDYGETDVAYIEPGHPLYNLFRKYIP